MLYCQQCKKQAATVHITDIRKGEKRERHLCETCANEGGLTHGKTVPFNKLLKEFVEKQGGASELAKLTCPDCGMSWIEFRNSGQLGCPADYDAFERVLVPLIERAHEGSSHHTGKIPRRAGSTRPVENDLVRLRNELTKALGSEKFEEAARIRDEIRTLEPGS